jgi:[glutamine synthetase] adenylyltransferase / [glutamine synthetase]-adenylyl-L-tyrosine phosphorylase
MPSSLDVTRLGAGLPERVATRIQLLLAAAPNPDAAARFMERLRQEAPSAFDRMASSPAALRCAITLFSYSSFLSESVLRNPERMLQVANSGSFYRVLSAEEYRERLLEFLGSEAGGVPSAINLARFRRRQLLRILLRDVLGVAALAEITEELSGLADAILDVTYTRIRADFVARHGEPRLADGTACGLSVISLGKLGGQELNYSSDIDLMFVYGGGGHTDGPAPISNKEFYKNVANQYTALLSTYTAEGQCYRVDLRLRPDGTLGEICTSLEGARTYYSGRARDWEKQMLIKARVSAGETEPGAALLEFVEPLIYQSSLDFRAVEAVSETRQRISEKVAAKKRVRKGLDVKLAPGGIRDIEFLVQCLQRLYGGREPWVRHGGTMFALFRLRDKGLLSGTEYARLVAAYQFLRHLEHRLQMDEDRQTHTLPSDAAALDLLARKMPHEITGETLDGEAMLRRVDEHFAAVLEIYDRVIHAQKPLYELTASERPGGGPVNPEGGTGQDTGDRGRLPEENLEHVVEQRFPRVAEAIRRSGLKRGRERFAHFLQTREEMLAMLDRDQDLADRLLDIFEHSGYFADEILRFPELVNEIGCEPEHLTAPDASTELRRFYRRQMLRVQGESMLMGAPIFDTLKKTSALADSVIDAAYRIALREAPSPASDTYEPSDQMMTIALGRLGMGEFDLGSDADLLFIIPDADLPELSYWTGVAERMIETVSSYTGDGVMFAVDTRLRPNGRAGDLVQSEGAYKAYFAAHAEAWEGIAYMKSRAVAGNTERATAFLHELQEVDWRRYGQSMRSRKELAEMRARLEREQGPRNPLKAGRGGYYDIDFALMYLRLRGAGIFYKVLNTPERIDVIEKMGHLDREDADFLRESATFFRALDHGQRVSIGHSEGSLPASPAQFEVLTNLVKRWTPEHLHRQQLDVTLREIRGKTREFFDRLFGK